MKNSRSGVRIIGGRWRGTRIQVADRDGLRPSSDRVRETLFNWLAPRIVGARCLDLFAGSGVLGFEALSRGAAAATLIENDATLYAGLEALKGRLQASTADIVLANSKRWLTNPPHPFDLVFVDPPFASNLLELSLARVHDGWLAPGGLIYIETQRGNNNFGPAWQIVKSSQTQQVFYALLEKSVARADDVT